jgi:hypothetical protein
MAFYNAGISVYAYKASPSDPDTLDWDAAMRDADVQGWLDSAKANFCPHKSKNSWIEVPLLDAKTSILPATWVFQRKRAPDGTIK